MEDEGVGGAGGAAFAFGGATAKEQSFTSFDKLQVEEKRAYVLGSRGFHLVLVYEVAIFVLIVWELFGECGAA